MACADKRDNRAARVDAMRAVRVAAGLAALAPAFVRRALLRTRRVS